jgi:hypothetical protein
MDQSLIYLIMGLGGLFLAVIPFGIFMGLATQFGIEDMGSPQLMVALFVSTIIVTYLSALGSFAGIQAQSCGKVKNMKQIAGNAGITTLIVVLSVVLAVFVPGLRNIVVKLFPPSVDSRIAEAMGYAYYMFWGGLYGFATGGYMAAVCGA